MDCDRYKKQRKRILKRMEDEVRENGQMGRRGEIKWNNKLDL